VKPIFRQHPESVPGTFDFSLAPLISPETLSGLRSRGEGIARVLARISCVPVETGSLAVADGSVAMTDSMASVLRKARTSGRPTRWFYLVPTRPRIERSPCPAVSGPNC
jgi:hypothetical protein